MSVHGTYAQIKFEMKSEYFQLKLTMHSRGALLIYLFWQSTVILLPQTGAGVKTNF